LTFKSVIASLTETGSYRDALFYHFPGGLRFELSEGDSPLDQVLTALRKATSICADVFPENSTILVHLQRWLQFSGLALRDTLRALEEAGLAIPAEREIWHEAVDENDISEDGYLVHCAFEVPAAKLQNLLWCALATDFPSLQPNPHCRVYLVDAANGILVHPYDDRGMDIICRRPALLKGLYEKHNRYLLDYDRETMDRSFDPA